MENVHTIYRELFSINFLHSGLGVSGPMYISDFLSLEPDEATKTLFTNYSMRTRFDNNVFACYIRCSLFPPPDPNPPPLDPVLADKQPKITFLPLENETRFRFSIKATNSFFGHTDLEQKSPALVYYFNNRENAATANLRISQSTLVGNTDLQNGSLLAPGNASLGVIDIFTSGFVNSDYGFYKPLAGILKFPGIVYTIEFKKK